jgi:hypothetical protein
MICSSDVFFMNNLDLEFSSKPDLGKIISYPQHWLICRPAWDDVYMPYWVTCWDADLPDWDYDEMLTYLSGMMLICHRTTCVRWGLYTLLSQKLECWPTGTWIGWQPDAGLLGWDDADLSEMMLGCWPYLSKMDTSSSQSRLLLSIIFTAYSI